MGVVIACANQKGGVGKTTTVVNLGTYLALAGCRVLLVDLDPQGNLTSGLGTNRAAAGESIYSALIDARQPQELVRRTLIERLSLIPAATELAGAEIELVGLAERELRLAKALSELRLDHDFVLLDCPPALGLLTVNALAAADAVLVPIQCEYYALEGLSQLLATIDLVRDGINPRLRLAGVLLTMFDGRTTLSADVAAEVRGHLGEAVFATVVPRSVRLAEAPSHGRPIHLHARDSRGAVAYRELARELLRRHGDGRIADSPTEDAVAVSA